ncbi:MAG: hypothetical protein V3T72_20470 [Thermoanaerobaculia bacterium]
MIEMEDEFLSEEDLDLRNMTWEELVDYWNLWLLQAQSTNDADPPYTHGVFVNLTWADVRMSDEEPPSDDSVR